LIYIKIIRQIKEKVSKSFVVCENSCIFATSKRNKERKEIHGESSSKEKIEKGNEVVSSSR
jgi:hypothetical protein